jgi:dihydrofolate synthase/folylpolyglutamate synthase
VVFGILNDKKIKEITILVNEFADIIIVTKSSSDRSLDPSKILIHFKKSNRKIIRTSSLPEGIKKGLSLAKDNDLIIITGSLTMVGDAKTFFASK